MAGTLNKQPIFTATPITVSLGLDLEKNERATFGTGNVTPIYQDVTTFGSLITKITVRANSRLDSTAVSTKRIDLYISDDGDSSFYNLYSSQVMTGVDPIELATPIPSVIFEFPNGLILQPGKKLGLSASTNSSESGNAGDLVSIIVEGGTYDQP